MNINYKNKYLKYKKKDLFLKKQLTGGKQLLGGKCLEEEIQCKDKCDQIYASKPEYALGLQKVSSSDPTIQEEGEKILDNMKREQNIGCWQGCKRRLCSNKNKCINDCQKINFYNDGVVNEKDFYLEDIVGPAETVDEKERLKKSCEEGCNIACDNDNEIVNTNGCDILKEVSNEDLDPADLM